MKFSKDFDQYLRITKTPEEYREDKVKAARIGGSKGRASPEVYSRLGRAMGLSNTKTPQTLRVICLKELKNFQKGKKYTIVMTAGAKMQSPTTHQFKNWYEFLLYFKPFKTI